MTKQDTLFEWLEKKKVQPEDLDDILHNAASSMASNSNNEGVAGQIDFLKIIAGWTDEEIKEALS